MGTVTAFGKSMILRVRHDMIYTFFGHVVYGDTDSMMAQFGHPPWLTTREEILDYYQQLMEIIEKHFQSVFIYPNKLIFETMKLPFILYKKKNYAAIEFAPKNLQSPERNIISKGLGYSKLDRCLFVYRVGLFVIQCVIKNELNQVMPYIKTEITKFMDNLLPLTDLSATTVMKRDDAYSNENLIHCFTAAKITKRSGKIIEAGHRLEFIVLEGDGPVHTRGECVQYATDNNLKIDKAHFLEKKLNNPIAVILTHHPAIRNQFETFIRDSCVVAKRKSSHRVTIAESIANLNKRKRKETYIWTKRKSNLKESLI